jgi:hypothetical protein
VVLALPLKGTGVPVDKESPVGAVPQEARRIRQATLRIQKRFMVFTCRAL